MPIWFARRLSSRAVWANVAEAAQRRPTTRLRILLTSTPIVRLHESALPGHVIVSVSDAIDFEDMAVRADVLAALLDGTSAVSVDVPLYLSPTGQQLIVHGNIAIGFKSEIHVAILRRLVEGYQDGKRHTARELLDHAQSSAKTLRQAFGSKRWAELEPYLKSRNGLWGFEL